MAAAYLRGQGMDFEFTKHVFDIVSKRCWITPQLVPVSSPPLSVTRLIGDQPLRYWGARMMSSKGPRSSCNSLVYSNRLLGPETMPVAPFRVLSGIQYAGMS